jgi:hypothetical protein
MTDAKVSTMEMAEKIKKFGGSVPEDAVMEEVQDMLASMEAEKAEPEAAVRPPCFVEMYLESDPDCKVCGCKKECAEAWTKAQALAAEKAEAEEEAAKALEEEKVKAEEEKKMAAEAAKAKKKGKKAEAKEAAKAKETKKAKEDENRLPLAELFKEGQIAEEGKYLKVGEEVYKSGVYKMKHLEAYKETGTPFKACTKFADAFEVLKTGKEVSATDIFESLKAKYPDAKDISLKTVASDVVGGAWFFGIAKAVRKEGRRKVFKIAA